MSDIKVSIQTLKNDKHVLAVNTADTIAQVKAKVEANLTLGIKATDMVLIHVGKVLEDDNQTLEEAKVADNDHMVIMKQRKKGKKKKAKVAEPEASPAPAPAPVADATPATPAPAAAPQTPAPATPAPEVKATETPSSASSTQASSSMALGSELQESIAILMGLGDYSHDQVTQALRAAYNNLDRAAEYLLTGIPGNILAQQAQGGPPQGGQAPAQSPAMGGQGGGMMDQGGDDAEMGGEMPQMDEAQMAQAMAAMQQNPQMLQALMQGISQQEGGQEMMAQLAQDPQQLMQVMAMLSQMGRGRGMPQGGGGLPGQGAMGGGGGQVPPGATTVTLNADEREQLQNLQALIPGISQQQALQAYLVCDRNFEMAANYLFDQMGNGF